MLIEYTEYALPTDVTSSSSHHPTTFDVFVDSTDKVGISTFVDSLYKGAAEDGLKGLSTIQLVNATPEFLVNVLLFANNNMLNSMLGIAEAKVAIKSDPAADEAVKDFAKAFAILELNNSEELKASLFNTLATSTTANTAYDEFTSVSHTQAIANTGIIDVYEEYYNAVQSVSEDTNLSDDQKTQILSLLKQLIA